MKKLNIILTGPRCVEKTNTGKHLAKLLDYKFIDAGDLLEERYEASINNIFSTNG